MDEAKSTWGPRLWAEIHSTSVKSTPRKFKEYLSTLGPRIPCEECQYHFKSYMFQNPMGSRDDPIIWAIDFHNDVNRRLGKPVLTYQQAYKEINVYKIDNTYNIIACILFIALLMCMNSKKML